MDCQAGEFEGWHNFLFFHDLCLALGGEYGKSGRKRYLTHRCKTNSKHILRSFGYRASSKTANFPAHTDCSSTRQMARLGASSVWALRGASRKGVLSRALLFCG
jgi:hypothetical protein